MAHQPSTSSTLVETVNINYEDFSESYLTCATCLCPFDERERKAKLLSCSHSVCRICLHTISQLPHSLDTGTFRCPICRATHQVPRGGVDELPASYLVNQLISLMQRQRRHIVPTCAQHSSEELLFCETCDRVFCCKCNEGEREIPYVNKNNNISCSCEAHTIVPFATAIKRMSEIVLYKANQCVKNLNRATNNVQSEQDTLDTNVDRILDEINMSFQDLSQLLDGRRRELIEAVRRTRDEKRRVLQEQLTIIQSEKAMVEQHCHGLQHQMEVHTITRKITGLNEKLDASLTLIEPRENAFLKYDSSAKQVLKGIQCALAHFGTLSVSRTYPPLCTAVMRQPCAVHVRSVVTVTTIDYNGIARTNGGDPVHACFVTGAKGEEPIDDIDVHVLDNQDGSYDLSFLVTKAATYKLLISIFNRGIKGMPLTVRASEHHCPTRTIGGRHRFNQPTRIAMSADGKSIYVMDTANDRIMGMNTGDTMTTTAMGDEGMAGGATVGMAINHRQSTMLSLNWRTRTISEHSLIEPHSLIRSFSFSEFVEPIDLAVDALGRVIVVDNALSKVFVFDTHAKPLFAFHVQKHSGATPKSPVISTRGRTVMQPRNGETPPPPPTADVHNANLTAVAVGMNEDILVAVGHEVYVYDSGGRYDRSIAVLPTIRVNRGSAVLLGGICVDRLSSLVLTSVTDVQRSFVAVSSYKGNFLFLLDSHGAKLRRPSGLCLIGDGEHCLVADMANHQVKQFRYK